MADLHCSSEDMVATLAKDFSTAAKKVKQET